MSNDILIVAEQLQGKLADVTFELLGKGRQLAAATGGRLLAVVLGEDAADLAAELGAADQVLALSHPVLAHFTPEGHEAALAELLRGRAPRLALIANTSMGMDLAAGLSARLGWPLAAYAQDVSMEGGQVVVTSQLYGGKLMVETAMDGQSGIVSVLAGAFPADAGRTGGTPAIEQMTPSLPERPRMRFKELLVPEAGDVDITREHILVSVGRGIQSQDNIELAEELAKALGGAVSASRPIIDAGWLPKSRQVGKSGLSVKPKLYLAAGISGAPEHLEGMRDAELIVALNTDASAPIFDVAHYGTTADLLDVLPALTEALAARQVA
ncbi:MAG: electron transfer flavoprotein subunit alpha/FixB family protein [Chloroflexota bacterium]|nr:electron transfer flavoprotein subunit alpha/FixB family protein [Chloroflexota bacterium]